MSALSQRRILAYILAGEFVLFDLKIPFPRKVKKRVGFLKLYNNITDQEEKLYIFKKFSY